MSKFDFVEALLASAVDDGVFPSAVAAIGVRDKVLFSCAAGKANMKTRFDLASMSKIYSTTMLALRALENGELTLQDTLSRFFATPRDKANITLFQLMTHTGGFTPSFWLFNETDDPEKAAEIILRYPLDEKPDGTPRYSCMGYILLGKLLEIVYGTTLDKAAQEHVFAPLGMSHTGYKPAGKNIAPTEVELETGIAWCGIVHDENAQFLGGVSGNAGIFSDLHDTTLFASMLACGGKQYLSPATLRKATSNFTPGHAEHRGLGFQLGGTVGNFMGDLFPDASYGHTGFTGTSMVVDPTTGLYVILLTNRIHPSRENEKLFRFRRLFHNRIYATYSHETQNA